MKHIEEGQIDDIEISDEDNDNTNKNKDNNEQELDKIFKEN